jgi:hypothetical protein
MRAHLRPALLSLLVVAGAFALGGCSEEEDLEEGSTLIIDDDRTTGTSTITVFYALGTGTPQSTTIAVGESKILVVANGTYTVTFDDNTPPAGIDVGDTKVTGVQVQTGHTTTVEYAGADDTGVIGPSLHANN